MTASDSPRAGASDPTTEAPDLELGARDDDDDSSGRRSMLIWIGGAVATLVVFFGVVIALNATVYSASGFVGRYLDALDRRDLASLLDMNGVTVPDGADP